MRKWLIKALGGHTKAEYWDLYLRFGELQENHRQTIDKLHTLIEKLTMRAEISTSRDFGTQTNKSNREEPIALTPTPWSKLRNKLEREDHLKHVESLKSRFAGKSEPVAVNEG